MCVSQISYEVKDEMFPCGLWISLSIIQINESLEINCHKADDANFGDGSEEMRSGFCVEMSSLLVDLIWKFFFFNLYVTNFSRL